jgi:hypothetical protein
MANWRSVCTANTSAMLAWAAEAVASTALIPPGVVARYALSGVIAVNHVTA